MKTKSRTWSYLLSFGLLLLFFIEPGGVAEHIRRGMTLCVRTMIPSLFPFMVVSELIVRSGAGEAIAKLPARLLRLPAGGVCASLLGALCGFPVGSRTAAEYYRRGRLTERQFHIVLSACNVPSVAFLVCAVGLSLYGRWEIGIGLVVLSLAGALSSGLGTAWLLPRKGEHVATALPSASQESEAESLSHMLPASISSAAMGMLGVCATVLLFSGIMGALGGILDRVAPGETARAALLGVLEMSGGVCAASLLADRRVALVLGASMIGWGGLSVHCQIFSACAGCPLNVRLFWLGRAWQALVCGGGAWLWLRFCSPVLPEVTPQAAWRDVLSGQLPWDAHGFLWAWTVVCGVSFLAACVFGVFNRLRKRRSCLW